MMNIEHLYTCLTFFIDVQHFSQVFNIFFQSGWQFSDLGSKLIYHLIMHSFKAEDSMDLNSYKLPSYTYATFVDMFY